MQRFFTVLILWILTVTAYGHAQGENYIFLAMSKEGKIEGRFEFHIDDLNEKLGMDFKLEDKDKIVPQLDEVASTVHDYIGERFWMKGDGSPIELQFTKRGMLEESSTFAQFFFEASVPKLPNILTFHHDLLYEEDRMHRGLLVLSYNPVTDTSYDEEKVAMIFNRSLEEQSLDLREPIPDLLTPRQFVWQGILHIWIGIDHILFLVVLLLPAVLRREGGTWKPVESFGKAMLNVIKIVTIFTIAHSITLGLAALDFISLPGQIVESIIAASIVLVAVNNIFPMFREGAAMVIFGFGLFHGMGFASVMSDIPFRMESLTKVLIAFNVGVEIGQVAIVVVAFALLFALRRYFFYQPVILRVGSAVAGLVAVFWFAQRAFGL